MPALFADCGKQSLRGGSAADCFRKKTPSPRVPEARKGPEYKSPQTNVNDADGDKKREIGATGKYQVQVASKQSNLYLELAACTLSDFGFSPLSCLSC
jgi:hypothetical protein